MRTTYRRRIKCLLMSAALAMPLLFSGCAFQGEARDAEVMAEQEERVFALTFYRYGEEAEEDEIRISPEQVKLYHGEELLGSYPYVRLCSGLLALYEEESQAYAVCRYELYEDRTGMSMELLGATSQSMVGDWDVFYTDQGSTAKLSLTPEGIGKEYEQTDAAGKAVGEETIFYYCLRGGTEFRRLLILGEDAYYVYDVSADEEERILTLTIAGEGSYYHEQDSPQ